MLTFAHSWSSMSWIHWHINPTATSSKRQPCSHLLEFSCDFSCSFVIGQFQWTSSRTHLLGWNVWQKPKYKFCVIMLITHISTLLRWDVKWFNFSQPTLLGQQCASIWPQPKLVWKLVNYQSISDNHETGKIKFSKNWQKLSLKIYLKLDYQFTSTHLKN